MNQTLLGKWILKFATDFDCSWKRLILEKYGVKGLGWRSMEVRGTFVVGLWNDIKKESFKSVRIVIPNQE